MFGKTWLWGIGFLLLVSVLSRSGLLFVVSLALLLAALASWLWERYCLTGVEYGRRFSQRRAFFGEEIELTVEVVNRKALPLGWLEIEDEIPRGLEPSKGRWSPTYKANRSNLSSLLSLRWYERVRRHYPIRCTIRGYHSFGPVRLRSGDIFGFSSRESILDEQDYLLIYPMVVPITRLGIPSKDPFGDLKNRQWLFEDPLRTVGVREYAYGDSPRRIHWKATARTQELQVKLYEPTTTYRLAIVLNLNTCGSYWWHGYIADLAELAICTAASLANWAIEQGYQPGLYVNGETMLPGGGKQRIRLVPSRDPEQITHILQALAAASPFTTMALESLLRLEGRGLSYGSTVAIITAVLNDDILAEVLALRGAGHAVALLLIGDNAPHIRLDGVSTYRIGGEAEWRSLAEIAVGEG